MDIVTPAIVLKQADRGEYDKLVTLFTPTSGVISALMRGVKKNRARLKAAGASFAFFEYSLVKKGHFYTVTGASELGDLSFVAGEPGRYFAAQFMAECTLSAVVEPDGDIFVELLKSLEALRRLPSLLCAVHYCQFLIHKLGYAYEYKRPASVSLPVDLLYYTRELSSLEDLGPPLPLLRQTFKAIVKNFENKFGASLKSAASLLAVCASPGL